MFLTSSGNTEAQTLKWPYASSLGGIVRIARARSVQLALERSSITDLKVGLLTSKNIQDTGGLRTQWDNLLPTCRDCNKSLRQNIVTAGMSKSEVIDLQGRRAATSFGKANQFDIQGLRAVGTACNLNNEGSAVD